MNPWKCMSVGGWVGSYKPRFKSACGCCLNGTGTSLSLKQDDENLDQLRGLGSLLQLAVGTWKFTAMACVT